VSAVLYFLNAPAAESPSNNPNEHFHLSLPLASISFSTLILDNFLFNSLCSLLSSAFFFCSIQSNIELTISDLRIDCTNLALTSNVVPNSLTSVINFSFVCDENDGLITVESKNKVI